MFIYNHIQLLEPKPLIYNNGWFSGLIDSDGSVYIDEKLWQLTITVTQKNKYLLEPLQNLYGGRIEILSSKDAFKYLIYRKKEILNLIDNYFIKYPLRSNKAHKINLIKEFYLKRVSKNNKDIIKLNEWIKFKDRWEKFHD